MSKRTLIAAIAGCIIVLAIVIARVDQTMMSADGDQPTPAVRDFRNPAAPALSQ